jgi:hypothetical protein
VRAPILTLHGHFAPLPNSGPSAALLILAAIGNMAQAARRSRLRGRGGARREHQRVPVRQGKTRHGKRLRMNDCTGLRDCSSPHIGVAPAQGQGIAAAQQGKAPTLLDRLRHSACSATTGGRRWAAGFTTEDFPGAFADAPPPGACLAVNASTTSP